MLFPLADIRSASDVLDWLALHGVRIGGILVVALVSYLVLRFSSRRVTSIIITQRLKKELTEEQKKRAQTLSGVFANSGSVLIFVVAMFTIVSELGISIGPLLAGFGVAGIAIGLAGQSLFKDIIRGVLIIIDNQFGKGDVVNIAGKAGIVEDVGVRRTVLRDLDGIVHYVPNSEIGVASNYTREWSRVNLDVPVAYKEDLDQVIQVINRVGKELKQDETWGPLIIEEPKVLRVNNFGSSGIDVKVLGTTKPIQQWGVMGELRKRIKKAFDEEGIEIPFPHLKVYWGAGAEPWGNERTS
ncbi:MAG: mechanosensitive ion channel family protein [Dehalococcoidia bacterium]